MRKQTTYKEGTHGDLPEGRGRSGEQGGRRKEEIRNVNMEKGKVKEGDK